MLDDNVCIYRSKQDLFEMKDMSLRNTIKVHYKSQQKHQLFIMNVIKAKPAITAKHPMVQVPPSTFTFILVKCFSTVTQIRSECQHNTV